MSDKKQNTFYNRSLERALKILCVFNPDRQTLTLGQLTEIIKLPMPTLMRLCITLMEYDFLRYDQQTKQYSLGLKLFELGSVVFSRFSLRKIVSPYLIQLQVKLGRTTFLGILLNDELVYIDKREDTRDQVRFASNIGTRRLPYFGMLGQLLLAFLPDKEVERILKLKPLSAITKKSIMNMAEFKKRLRTIRKNGFFIDEEEAIEGVSGISAPIRDFTGRVVAAIGVGFISSSENQDGRQLIIKETLKTSSEISQELGYVVENGNTLRRPASTELAGGAM
jgi:DNA-binding IclR family transcriptional regulator